MEQIIYLDNNSTTPIDPLVLDAMLPFLKDQYANPSSTHLFGMQVKKTIETAKSKVADLLDTDSRQLIFTSGATESINLALKSLIGHASRKKHIITLQTEHKATLDTCNYLEKVGFEISYLPVKKDGMLDMATLQNAIRPDSFLVSIMWVNNETGVIQDVAAIGDLCHENDILFMTDATQAVGKIPIRVSDMSIDFLTLSGHKYYAPKGIGALYYSPKAKSYLEAQLHGGGQEQGLRSGTTNTSAIVGLGKASEIAKNSIELNESKVKSLRDQLEKGLLEIPHSFVNGNVYKRLFNVSNICFPGLEADILIGRLRNIALSNGSACTSEIIEPSHVLKAMGLSDAEANASIRFSLGKFNTEEEIIETIQILKKVIPHGF